MSENNNKKAVRLRPRRKKMNGFESFISSIIPWKGDPKEEVIRKIVFLVAIVTLVVLGIVMLNFYLFRENENDKDAQYWAEVKKDNVPEQLSAFDVPAEPEGTAPAAPVPPVAEEAPKAQKPASNKSRVGTMFDLLTFSDV